MSIKNNDFFNLNSESSDSEVDEKKDAKKWDWDRAENYDLYFSKNPKKHSIENEEDYLEKKKKNKKCEQPTATSISLNSNYKKLIGHTDCVNRIYWSKKNENLLLSSSMDR